MATMKRTNFTRRTPDHVTDELLRVLADTQTHQWNDLFGEVYHNLKTRNAVSGGEDMLRLRAYDKLRDLVRRGFVEKNGRVYRGLDRISDFLSKVSEG